LRDGLARYPAPLGAIEIDALIALGWLRAVNVRFAPNATEVLRCRELAGCAIIGIQPVG
jgi:Putative undecaprenyl diphosphate synthase